MLKVKALFEYKTQIQPMNDNELSFKIQLM